MKNLFRNKKLLGLCLMAAIFVSCEHTQPEEQKLPENTILDAGVSVKTPDWTKILRVQLVCRL